MKKKQSSSTKKEPKEKSIRIIPLGGLGAIGKNITLFEYDNSIIIVDCGISFPGEGTPGIDFIIPDFSYIRENKKKVKAVVITHGHEDHIGAIPYLMQEIDAPIYGTKLTLGLIQSRLAEHPLTKQPKMVEVKPRDVQNMGPFSVEFINVNHSIIGGVGLAIKTDLGTIIHSGDFKIDFSPVDGDVTDIYRFADHGEKGVLLLMSDSTNAEKAGFTKSESVLVEKLVDIFSSSRGRIIVATFASNIHRIQQVMDVAQRFNRNVAISGLSMQKNIEISDSLGYLSMKKDLIVSVEKANTLPHKKLVVIGTGTQGEPMSALSRMASGTHRHFRVQRGDTVIITASVIPGNERLVTNIVNTLMSLGADVYYDRDEDIHVSGHGSAKELKLMISVTKPRFFMPVHGEFKHLKAHADIAESLNIKPSRILIAECGDILELTPNSFKKTGKVELSQIYIDGKEIGDASSDVIKDRHAMSTDGVVVISLVISEGMLLRDPDISTRGVLGDTGAQAIETLRKDVRNQVKKMLKKNMEPGDIETNLKNNLKNLLYRLTKRNSVIIVQVLEV